MTPVQARQRAIEALAGIGGGADPVEEQRVKNADQEVTTLREFASLYLEQHAKHHRKSWPEDKRRLEKHIVSAMGNKRLDAVKRTDVASLHAKIGARSPVEANRVVQLLRAVYNYANSIGVVPKGFENPAEMDADGKNGVKPFRERSRQRYVLQREMPKLLNAIDEEENPYVRAAFQLFLYMGLRRSELLGARWEHLDLDRGRNPDPRYKVRRVSGSTHLAPSGRNTAGASRMLGNPHVFPGHKKGTNLKDVDKNWQTVRERAGCPDLTLHDLRRTVGSWMATSGTSIHVIGKVLGHAPGDTKATAIYAQLAQEAPNRALDTHAAAIEEAMEQAKKLKERTSA